MDENPKVEAPKPRKTGAFYRSGFYRKTLDDGEHALFDQLYDEVRRAFPDMDEFGDDALLIEFIKTQIKLQRTQPPPTPAVGNTRAYDYQMARAKLLLSFADALGMTRKQRKEQESGKDIEATLKKFFTQDGRTRDSSRGRTVKKEVVAEVDAAIAERFQKSE